MNMEVMLGLILSLLVLHTIAILSIFIVSMNIFIKKYVEISNRRLDISSTYNEQDIQLLDNIISETFNEYRLTQLEYVDSLYINEELQKTILYDVLKTVMMKISPSLRHKIGLYYNPEYIDDIIYQKIQLLVIDYTISTNEAVNK